MLRIMAILLVILSFISLASAQVEVDITHEYSTLIVDEDKSTITSINSTTESSSTEVKTYLRGDNIDAEFSSDGQSYKTFQLDPNDPEVHQIRVEGRNTGETELKIITEDKTLNLNRTETFPVYVRDSVDEGLEVPGLTSFYLLFILLAGSYLYFVSL